MNGLQEVNCRYCGENLGAQDDRFPIDWEMWPHRGCTGRIADKWDVDVQYVEEIKRVLEAAIASAYPDITGTIGDPKDHDAIHLRGRIAASIVLDVLAGMGYRIEGGT